MGFVGDIVGGILGANAAGNASNAEVKGAQTALTLEQQNQAQGEAFQNDVWSDNVYNGPSTFFAWNQGNGDNPVTWQNWTGSAAQGVARCADGGTERGSRQGPGAGAGREGGYPERS